jgi:hypothetical protein
MKHSLIKAARQWHRFLLWPAMLALFAFVISGLTHPLLTWTGPQTNKNMPPQAQFDATQTANIASVLQRHDIAQAAIVKLVPTARGNLLQVTQDDSAPRRYFQLDNGIEFANFDREQAQWLARHYTGLDNAEITDVKLKTVFDDEYPWVNRLLPVYQVSFAGEQGLRVNVHTETGALADISNDYKRNVQKIFQHLHTFRFLDATGHGRVILMMLLLCSLLATVIAGAALLYAITRRRIPHSGRRWHRVLAHLVWIPLFAFTASGIYHLLYQHTAENVRGLQLAAPLSLQINTLSADFSWLIPLQEQRLNNISLVAAPNKTLYYRVSFPAGKPDHSANRQQRFDGVTTEKPALYINAHTGQADGMDDAKYTRALAKAFLQIDDHSLDAGSAVTHFGPDYDFRNKRLPAWKFTVSNETKDLLFIDPATGSLIDRVPQTARWESLSFSVLHKWNFLTHSIGREKRDVLMVLVLTLGLALAILGVRMRTSRH